MAAVVLKSLLPNRPVPCRVWRGPFRGARVVMNPRHSLRKVFGLYEHELNAWLELALGRVDRVVDIGANDGYFTFGCSAALHRHGRNGSILAFEPEECNVRKLRESLNAQPCEMARVEIVQSFVGSETKPGMTTLDALNGAFRRQRPSSHSLIKIDVEGAELDVIAGAQTWLLASNLFVIEVHKFSFVAPLQKIFRDRDMSLARIDQRALPFLGREKRELENCWLVSELSPVMR